MRAYTQETDSTPLAWTPRPWFEDQNVTFGDLSDWSPMPIPNDLVGPALKAVTQVEDQGIAQLAISILYHIKDIAALFERHASDLGHLPRFQGFSVDDGSFLLEWIFGGFRVGFSLERDLRDSSWHLVSDSSLGDMAASGRITRENIRSITLWLFTFVVLHA